MKILLVAIPNHHFFQWTNQLKDAGYEVYWFDITDGAGFSNKISWVKQFNGWKLKWNYPFRHGIKNRFPKLYAQIQKINENNAETTFEKIVNQIQPDVIHVFEMQLAGYPIFDVLQKKSTIPVIYSSWGSDMFQYERLGLTTSFVKEFLNRINFLITDCIRDYNKALELGFKNTFLGVFPGNGGIKYLENLIKPYDQRKYILIKGYEDGVGKAINVLNALQQGLLHLISNYKIVIYSADNSVVEFTRNSKFYQEFEPIVYPRYNYVSNDTILEFMGNAVLHIANSASDGMPNVVLEAMGMGAFPIQTNPGRVTEEVIKNRVNGLLIEDSDNVDEIANLIKEALLNEELRENAQRINVEVMNKKYNREVLKLKIVALYSQILN